MILTETRHTAGFLISEAKGHRSRDRVLLSGGAKILAGQVLGRRASGTATVTAKPGNVGAGVLTIDATTAVLPYSQLGIYAVRCIAAAANAGTFRVFDPTGDVLGDVAIGATFTDQIKFVIADGTPDFAIGDEFDVAVSAIGRVYVPFSPTATDGSQVASALSFTTVDTTAADQLDTVIARDAEVNGYEIIWPSPVTSSQVATGVAQLSGFGIIVK